MRRGFRAMTACLLLAAAALRAGADVSAPYLLRGVSPQEDALGQCALAAQGSAAQLWRDPSLMGSVAGAGFALSHGLGPLGGDAEYLAAAWSWDGRSSLGLQGYYQGDTDNFRDGQGVGGASFTNQESLLGLAYAQRLGSFSAGVGVKTLAETLAGQPASPGLMADLGLRWASDDGDWQLALTAQDWGTAPQWPGGASLSPCNFGLSACQRLGAEGRWRLFEDARLVLPLGSQGFRAYAAPVLGGLGIERAVASPALPVFVRLGYARGDDDAPAPYGLAGGFGLGWQGWRFDYAFTWLGDLGGSHRLGLSWSPDGKPAVKAASGA